MSFNFLVNSFDGSVGCKVNNSEISNSTNIYNGKIRNAGNQNPGFKTLNNFKNNIKVNTFGTVNSNESLENNIEDKKFGFSEKLRVLLKNGESKSDKNKLPDPYAFSDIDVQRSQQLNTFEQYVAESVSPNMKSNNGTSNKSIGLSGSLSSQSTASDSVKEKDCFSESSSNINKNVKLAKFAVPLFATNNIVATNLNQAAYKLQVSDQLNVNKISSVKNGKTTAQVHLSSNSKPLFNKFLSKAKLQSVKIPNINSTLKSNFNTTVKSASSFNSNQVSKQGNFKGEKKLDKKHKNFQKGKSLLNQIQKTAYLNRPVIQQIKKNKIIL